MVQSSSISHPGLAAVLVARSAVVGCRVAFVNRWSLVISDYRLAGGMYDGVRKDAWLPSSISSAKHSMFVERVVS